jgi:hypothetical protein
MAMLVVPSCTAIGKLHVPKAKFAADYTQSKTLLCAVSPCIAKSGLLDGARKAMEREFGNEGKGVKFIPADETGSTASGKGAPYVYLYCSYDSRMKRVSHGTKLRHAERHRTISLAMDFYDASGNLEWQGTTQSLVRNTGNVSDEDMHDLCRGYLTEEMIGEGIARLVAAMKKSIYP